MKELTFHILKYIFNSFGIKKSLVNSQSLFDDQFELTEKLSFEEDGVLIEKNIYSFEISNSDTSFKFAAVNCSSDSNEYCFISNVTGSPYFGGYIDFSDQEKPLFCIANNEDFLWVESSINIQAGFLSATENIKNVNITPIKTSKPHELVKGLKSLINFYQDFYYPSATDIEESITESII